MILTMAFHPSRNFVSFRDVPNGKTAAGLTLPPGSVEKRAQVIDAGPGKYLPNGAFRPTCVKPGDYITFAPNAYIHGILINGELIQVTEDDYISGTLDEEDVIGKPDVAKIKKAAEEEEKRILDTSDDLQVMKIVAN